MAYIQQSKQFTVLCFIDKRKMAVNAPNPDVRS